MGKSRWYLTKDNSLNPAFRVETGQGYAIRRYERIDGKTKWERLPREEYDSTLRTEKELQAFIERLNKAHFTQLERAKETYELKHKFITQKTLDAYLTEVMAKATDQQAAQINYKKMHRHFLHFFVNKLKLNDPLDWFANQALWGAVLMNEKPKNVTQGRWEEIRLFPQGEKRSAKTIRDIVMLSNRFYKWLHTRHPKLFPLLIFEPLTQAQLRLYEGKQRLDKRSEPLGQYVKPSDWATISKKLDADLKPFVWLAYHFGLRAAETLGVSVKDIKTGFLHVQKQLTALPEPDSAEFGPLKNRLQRKVFYWFTTPDETHEVVSGITTLMHSSTLSKRVSDAISAMDLPYKMHDFRRTFITRALREGKSLPEVRDAAGHSSIETTNRYVMRDEEFDSEVFTPKKKSGKTG